jgi:para-nitrobenzyl esterase
MKILPMFIVALTSGLLLVASAALTSIAMLATASSPADGPVVKTQSGDVQGVEDHNIFSFKGIPYAAPPVGNLRWHKPQPAPSWQGVRGAKAYGNA